MPEETLSWPPVRFSRTAFDVTTNEVELSMRWISVTFRDTEPYVTIAGDQGGTLNGMTVPMGQHGRQRAVLDAFGGQPLGPSEAISARAGRADRRRTTMGP